MSRSGVFDETFRQQEIARWQNLDLHLVGDQPSALVFVSKDLGVYRLAAASGLIIGDLFDRSSGASSSQMLPMTTASEILEQCWGSYIAVFMTDRSVSILRDPAGGLACFTVTAPDYTYYSSNLDFLLAAIKRKVPIDWAQLRHLLLYPGVRTRRTALCGVEEILPGTSVDHIAGDVEARTTWSPWSFTETDPESTPVAFEISIREAVEHSVTAWARVSGHVLIELSGGLDSSIIAACLQGHSPPPHCANLVTPDGGADERRYAQPMAKLLDVPLRTLFLKSAAVEVPPPLRLSLPLPGVGVLQSAVDILLAADAQSIGAESFFSGGGGDNVFCYLHTAAPATDALRTFGPGQAFHTALLNLTRLHDCSYWTALRLAIRKYWRGSAWASQVSSRFLTTDGPPLLQMHPWHAAPPRALPGKREHVMALIRAQNLYDLQERTQIGPMRYPLLSQPVMEACLRVPTWFWIEGGRNRAIARDAFTGRLPPLVAHRKTKGEFTGFCGEIYEARKPFLRDFLLGGLLAQQGLLNCQAIEAYLSHATPARDIGFCDLLDLTGVENWCRQWGDTS